MTFVIKFMIFENIFFFLKKDLNKVFFQINEKTV